MASRNLSRGGSSAQLETDRIVADPIHGPVALTEVERRVIDTASFQRLRYLKQLGLAQAVYPNATHTRFAHSLGVLAIMSRVLEVGAGKLKLSPEDQQDYRLAALLHDVGHYPYSHLMERADHVLLTEDLTKPVNRSQRTIRLGKEDPYPDHEELGRLIVTKQEDLLEVIGGAERANRVADIFTRSQAAQLQFSRLIRSSLDMDRLDYLVRDSRAAGVPYGETDFRYLLNNLDASPKGMVGIRWKALSGAEQFVFARYFMHRVVYYHKTVFGLEEAFRQLVRRCRGQPGYDLPPNGSAVRELVGDRRQLPDFTDQFLDRVARRALEDKNPVIARLAKVIVYRKPPKLLREECVLIDETSPDQFNRCSWLEGTSREKVPQLARQFGLPLGLFLVGAPPPIRLEKRGHVVVPGPPQPPEEEDELIKVFKPGKEEPMSLVDIPESIIGTCAHRTFRITRLYVLEDDPKKVRKMRDTVAAW
jgi:HD superfamily phosphohydrolase